MATTNDSETTVSRKRTSDALETVPLHGYTKYCVESKEENEPIDYFSEINKMLESFDQDVSKALVSKEQIMEKFTEEAFDVANKEITTFCETQNKEIALCQTNLKPAIFQELDKVKNKMPSVKKSGGKLLGSIDRHIREVEEAMTVQREALQSVQNIINTFKNLSQEMNQKHTEESSNVERRVSKNLLNLQRNKIQQYEQDEIQRLESLIPQPRL